MSSSDGAQRADISTRIFDDVKVKRLARRQQDDTRTLATMSVYIAAIVGAWSEDRPVNAVDACPAWVLSDVAEIVADLVAVELLDESGCVPADTLDRWMSGVRHRISAGRQAASKRWSPNGSPMGTQSHNQLTNQLTNQKRAPARPRKREETDDPRSLKEILAATTGEPDIAKAKEAP